MEMTRRENDRRIQALYVEMKDMMAVLIQLVYSGYLFHVLGAFNWLLSEDLGLFMIETTSVPMEELSKHVCEAL